MLECGGRGKEMTAAEIITLIVGDGLVSSQETLETEFELEASDQGWSDEEIQAAIKSPWFPDWE